MTNDLTDFKNIPVKFLFGFLILQFCCIQNTLAQDYTYHSPYNGFEKGDTLYTFNMKNKVYKNPTIKSEAYLQLPANTSVKVAKSIETDYDNPYDPEDFLQVIAGGKMGFMQRKDLTAARVPIEGSNRSMLFQFYLDTNLTYALKYREFYEKSIVNETKLELMTSSFNVYMIHPKGIDSLTGILVLDHLAEACGYDGGDTYYYYDPERLEKMAHLISVGDGGVYYRTERLIFPSDEGGLERKVIFEGVEMYVIDEETEWEEIKTERRVYKWLDGRLYPAFERYTGE
jgi:hypothetical protein